METKSGLVKLNIIDGKIIVEGESETKTSDYTMNAGDNEIITYASNSKSRSVSTGIYSNSLTVFNLDGKNYTSTVGGGGRNIFR